MRNSRSRLLLGIMMAALVFPACSDDSGTTPTSTAASAAAGAPVIRTVDANNQGNGVVNLKVTATDPNGGQLKFNWHTSDGQLSATSAAAIQWLPPKNAGTYSVLVDVTNDKGLTTTGSQSFTVTKDGNATANGSVSTASSGSTSSTDAGNNGQIQIPLPVGSGNVAQPIVGGVAVPSNPPSTSAPIIQPVSTPLPAPSPTTPPLQPIATPTVTPPPQSPAPSPLPTAQPPTPQPGVPVAPPLRWVPYSGPNLPNGVNFTSVYMFPDNKRAWIVGSGGTVLFFDRSAADPDPMKYKDPAMVSKSAGVPQVTINRVTFTDDTHGFIAGQGGTVLRTRDGGTTWENMTIPQASDITAMAVVNSQILVVGDITGSVWRTDSANADVVTNVVWTPMISRPADRPGEATHLLKAAATFQPSTTLTYLVGDGIYRLDANPPDPTKAWVKLFTMAPANNAAGGDPVGDGTATAIKMTSPNDIWVTTFTGNLLHSTDAGATWKRTMRNAFKNREFNGNYQFLEPPQAMTSLALPDANNLFIAVGTGGVIDSTNSGTDWREMTTPSFGDITMRFDVVNGVAGFKGLAVGGGSTFYEYRSGVP